MAHDLGTQSKTYKRKEWTWRIWIEGEHGDDPVLRIHRERLTIDADTGAVVGRDRDVPVVERRLSTLDDADKALVESWFGLADRLRQEDIAYAEAQATEAANRAAERATEMKKQADAASDAAAKLAAKVGA